MDGVSNSVGAATPSGLPAVTVPAISANPAPATVPAAVLPLGVGLNAASTTVSKSATLPLTTGVVPNVSAPLLSKASDSSVKMPSNSMALASTSPAAASIPQVTPPIVTRPTASSDKVLDKRRLQELVKEVDPLEQLEEDVEEMLLQIADDFIDNVVTAGCQMAKHRKSNTVEAKDIQLHLERNWNMWIPGFGSEELRPYRKAATTEAHKQRLALIKKTLKKY